ncbi:MAG: DUF357 domain-containing protein [Candidatus Aenigmatarchaeota archaeon]
MRESTEIKKICNKEITKMREVLDSIKIVDEKSLEIYNLALSYYTDSKYFYKKKDYLRSFEAIIISWAYIDVGLHLKLFEIPEKLKIYFTIE